MSSIIHHVKRHFHERYRVPHGPRAHLVLTFDLTLVAIILALLGIGSYFAFFYKPLRDDFRFEVISSAPIVAGRETTVQLRISNLGSQRLHNARLVARLPSAFHIAEWPPGNDPAAHTITVGTIKPKGVIMLPLRGTVYGPPATETVYVRMLADDDKGQPDEKIYSVNVHWSENLIKGALAFPAKVVGNQTFPVRFTLTNGTTQRFDDVHVVPHWPKNFQAIVSTPPMAGGKIAIGPLDPGETVTVEILGRYAGHAEDFSASVETVWSADGEDILLDRTDIQRSSIDVNFSAKASFVNGAAVFAPGDDVPVKIDYRNDSQYALQDVRLSLPLDPNLFDQKAAEYAFAPIREIAAGATGTVTATLHLLPAVSRYVSNPTLKLAPTTTFSIASPSVTDVIVAGTGAQARISGTADLVLAARYFTSEGDQVGRGPLPPHVGKPTRYWIFASVSTGANGIADGRARIVLPANVAWTGQQAVSAGDPLRFDDASRSLIWDIGALDPHTGTTSSAVTASFEVSFTPSAGDVGRTPALASSAAFSGQDLWGNIPLSASAGSVTTKLTGDEYAQGKGVVKP